MGPSVAPNVALDAVSDPAHRRSATKDLARRRGGRGGPPTIVTGVVGGPTRSRTGRGSPCRPAFWPTEGEAAFVLVVGGPACRRQVVGPPIIVAGAFGCGFGVFFLHFVCQKITNKSFFSSLKCRWGGTEDGGCGRRGTKDGCPGSGDGDGAGDKGGGG